jgi:hypothetical protein
MCAVRGAETNDLCCAVTKRCVLCVVLRQTICAVREVGPLTSWPWGPEGVDSESRVRERERGRERDQVSYQFVRAGQVRNRAQVARDQVSYLVARDQVSYLREREREREGPGFFLPVHARRNDLPAARAAEGPMAGGPPATPTPASGPHPSPAVHQTD